MYKSILRFAFLFSFLTSAGAVQAQFGPPTIIDTLGSAGGSNVVLRTGDINGDGIPDIVRLANNPSSVNYYFGTGTGAFSAAHPVSGPFTETSDVLLEDFNADGNPDLLVLDSRGYALYLYPNANGAFSSRSAITSPKLGIDGVGGKKMVSGDFTNDGKPDVLVMEHFTVLLFPGLGNGNFDTARSVVPVSLQTELYELVKGNFNGDAFPDFAIATSGFMTFFGNSTGGFTYAGQTNGSVSFLLAPGDLNGDGIDDMIMKDHKSHILINNGSGVFSGSGLLKPANVSYRDFEIADIDGDGRKDLYGVYDQQNRAVWFKNLGGGVLDTQQVIFQAVPPTGYLFACALRDMNGDGKPDAMWGNVNGVIGIQLNTSTSGTIQTTAATGVRVYPNPIFSGNPVWIETVSSARLSLVNSFGQQISRMDFPAGKHALDMPYPPGIYFLHVSTDKGTSTQKISLVD